MLTYNSLVPSSTHSPRSLRYYSNILCFNISFLLKINYFVFFLPCSTSLIGAQDRSENTPLHYAAKKGHLEAVKLLLVKSTEEDMKQEDKDGNYPVHVAASAGHARYNGF